MPSMSPMIPILTPKTLARKRGNVRTATSLEKSLSSETTPNARTVGSSGTTLSLSCSVAVCAMAFSIRSLAVKQYFGSDSLRGQHRNKLPTANDPLIRLPRLSLRDRRRRRGRPILAVGFLNLRPHFLQAPALVHHSHHVTRDAYADASGQAHSIEFQFFSG
jgi:hypothetical protein